MNSVISVVAVLVSRQILSSKGEVVVEPQHHGDENARQHDVSQA